MRHWPHVCSSHIFFQIICCCGSPHGHTHAHIFYSYLRRAILVQSNLQILSVELNRGWNSRLGFSLQNHVHTQKTFISAIYNDSVAAKDGRLRVGDEILRVSYIFFLVLLFSVCYAFSSPITIHHTLSPFTVRPYVLSYSIYRSFPRRLHVYVVVNHK